VSVSLVRVKVGRPWALCRACSVLALRLFHTSTLRLFLTSTTLPHFHSSTLPLASTLHLTSTCHFLFSSIQTSLLFHTSSQLASRLRYSSTLPDPAFVTLPHFQTSLLIPLPLQLASRLRYSSTLPLALPHFLSLPHPTSTSTLFHSPSRFLASTLLCSSSLDEL